MSHAGLEECDCVATHTPAVGDVEIHHIWPLGANGPDVAVNRINRCPTTHSNIHAVERLWKRYKGKPPWELLRKYSASTRELGRRAYQSGVEQRLVP